MEANEFASMVPRTGFEPVISAVRGRRPKPLDQRGKKKWLPGKDSNPHIRDQNPLSYP